jgi:hypothetical protein
MAKQLRKKLSYKSKKLVKNMNEDARLMRSMGAFSEDSMYMSDYEVQEVINTSFEHITSLRNDWD